MTTNGSDVRLWTPQNAEGENMTIFRNLVNQRHLLNLCKSSVASRDERDRIPTTHVLTLASKLRRIVQMVCGEH
jgi:hypothetical protein